MLCLTDSFYFTPWNGIQLTFIFHVRNNDELPLIAKMKQLIDSHPVFFRNFQKTIIHLKAVSREIGAKLSHSMPKKSLPCLRVPLNEGVQTKSQKSYKGCFLKMSEGKKSPESLGSY